MDHHFEMAEIVARRRDAGKPWLEFLRADSLSMGLYVLAAGARDLQSPHSEDEVYYIISGRGMLRIAQNDHPIQPGTVLFVAAGEEHRFHSISEEMTAIVFFAPAAGPKAGGVPCLRAGSLRFRGPLTILVAVRTPKQRPGPTPPARTRPARFDEGGEGRSADLSSVPGASPGRAAGAKRRKVMERG